MTEVGIRELTVEYSSGGFPVRPLDRFNASVESGSLTLLLGPSGCGKSTMLSCLAGILSPTEGEIHVGGTAVHALSGAEMTAYRQRGVGIVFQSFNLVPSLSALENVVAPLRAASMSRRPANDRAARLLASVGLEREAARVPSRLSGGQQQRVAIARALAHDPPLLLADEPTAHLDYIQVEEVLRLLRGLAAPGRSVIVATHDERMLPLADSVIEMTPKFADGADAVEERDLDAGDVLFEQGSRGSRIYVVGEGEIDIVRSHDDGREEVLAVVRKGDHFGEMGPLFNLPRSATARARTPARVTGYTVRQFGSHVGLDRLGNLLGKAKRESPRRKGRVAPGRARAKSGS